MLVLLSASSTNIGCMALGGATGGAGRGSTRGRGAQGGGIILRLPYAKSGTDIGYATRRRQRRERGRERGKRGRES
eukprot:692728-Rhodomonas_salina.2